MDNRITKKRLSDFLAYEWIIIIFACVIAIVVWEFIYTVSAVRLTVGQSYKFYYDTNMVYGESYAALMGELGVQEDLGYSNGKTFSYEIQKIESESIIEDSDVLATRLSIQDGDMLFTDDKPRATVNEGVETTRSKAKSRVDTMDIPFTTYEQLLKSAEEYLTGFLIEGQTEINKENLDSVKIENAFNQRLRKDNRLNRNMIGVSLERERLEKLCEEVNDFRKLMELSDEYFFTYTRFTQAKEIAEADANPNQKNVDAYKGYIENEIANGRENARYGLRVDALKNRTSSEKLDASKFFSVYGETENFSANAVILVFDFLEYQPELQFESITVINNIVRACSTILD